jgi:sec-independent protein translocase protein TatB
VFGLSLAELLLLLVVGVVVVGPRNLPGLMRQAGRWVAKIRRMSVDLRSQSGIDDLIRQEGLERELAELRNLSRVNVIDTVLSPMMSAASAAEAQSTRGLGPLKAVQPFGPPAPAASGPAPIAQDAEPIRAREYPLVGCDHYDALPDDVAPYVDEPAAEPSAPGEREYPVAGCDAYGTAADEHAGPADATRGASEPSEASA